MRRQRGMGNITDAEKTQHVKAHWKCTAHSCGGGPMTMEHFGTQKALQAFRGDVTVKCCNEECTGAQYAVLQTSIEETVEVTDNDTPKKYLIDNVMRLSPKMQPLQTTTMAVEVFVTHTNVPKLIQLSHYYGAENVCEVTMKSPLRRDRQVMLRADETGEGIIAQQEHSPQKPDASVFFCSKSRNPPRQPCFRVARRTKLEFDDSAVNTEEAGDEYMIDGSSIELTSQSTACGACILRCKSQKLQKAEEDLCDEKHKRQAHQEQIKQDTEKDKLEADYQSEESDLKRPRITTDGMENTAAGTVSAPTSTPEWHSEWQCGNTYCKRQGKVSQHEAVFKNLTASSLQKRRTFVVLGTQFFSPVWGCVGTQGCAGPCEGCGVLAHKRDGKYRLLCYRCKDAH